MISKLRLVFAITIAFLSFSGYAQKTYWQQEITPNKLSENFSNRFKVSQGKLFTFDEQQFKNELKELGVTSKGSKTIYFPNMQGKLIAFRVVETPVLSPDLSLKYPNIKSYSGYAVTDSKVKIRFSVSHKGVQSMMVNADEASTVFLQKDAGNKYVLYKRDPNGKREANFICETKQAIEEQRGQLTQRVVNDQILRKFRLAVTASGEYTQYHGGTVADALAAINATITRINQVFETDLAITLELVPNLDQVIFTDASTDPYSGSLSPKVQSTLDNILGSANYDLGILFNRANQGDGNAGFIGAVCVNNRKGSAYASGPNPEGDLFDLDFVAHEMGHQFGANHTWSFESEGTQVQVEPGSGTTIMGYAGITNENDVAPNGDDYFHYVSIVQITDYLKTVGCAQTIALTNTPPSVIPTGSFTIPISTPFVLSADASDVDATDVLTFAWEQIDVGIVTQSIFGPTNPIGANFRSQKPSTSPDRYFPKLSRVLAGQLTQTSPAENSAWETVSDIERELNFALTVRDNALGGGQVVADLVNVFVENSAGPFLMTSQNTTFITTAGSIETIVWDVANTNMAPINVQTVDIMLSIDGGQTFAVTLAENVANDGSHDVVMPGDATTTEARIMIRANGNIFYAINAADFTIEGSDIVLSMENLDQEVCQNDILVVPFNYQTFNGFAEESTFSIVSPPAGVDIAIFPETATVTDTAIEITFTDTENLAVGSYPITVAATTSSLTKELTFNLNVYNSGFADVTLLAPVDGLVDTSTSILLEWESAFLATSYDLEVATDILFTNIVESPTVVGDSFGLLNLMDQTQYFWRIKPINNCGEGSFSAPFSFTTTQFSCMNKIGEELPLAISSTGRPTVVSEITVFDDLPVSDINVNLEIDHSYLADLTITLTSPAGTSVVLMNNTCAEFQNINATFDDSATTFMCSGDPAVSGVVKPQGSLSSFNGESTFGTWVLSVADNAPADGGIFKSFSLDICGEGAFRPDDDGDGVFDDGPDLCLNTPAGATVDATGCPVLIFPSSNFRVQVQSESCRTSNDGSIAVEVTLPLNYAVTVNGNNTNISDNFSASEYRVTNLMAGSYVICFTATDGTLDYREQCFEVVIEEPELLSVSSLISIDGSTVDLKLVGGSLYTIALNGVVTQTTDSEIKLDLKEGANTLKVTTNLECQGTYEEAFFYATNPLVYPNPFTDRLNISFGKVVAEIKVMVYAANGRLVKNKKYSVKGTELEIDVSELPVGMYFMKYISEEVTGTAKVIKR